MIADMLIQFHSLTQSGINNDERSLVVVDNFYKDPDGIRNYTINGF